MIAQDGHKVKVHYCGKLADGTIFDTSYEAEPLQFIIGKEHVISGFENAVKGMKTGDKKEVFIPCEEAYGKRSDDFILELQKAELPEELNYEIGQKLQLELMPELDVNVEIIEIKENTIVFDANHQLADKDLIFDIELMEILPT